MATASVFLASKTLEERRALTEFCRSYLRLTSDQSEDEEEVQSRMENLKERIMKYEIWILGNLKFEMSIELPYPYFRLIKEELRVTDKYIANSLTRIAYNFANDSYYTRVCLAKSAEAIARACMYLAVQYLRMTVNVACDIETVNLILGAYQTLLS